MVREGAILLGVEHLEKRRRWVAAEVAAELVDLVEHEDGARRAGLLHPLDDLPRKRADIGAAVPADLRFVVRSAERHAHELAAHGTR